MEIKNYMEIKHKDLWQWIHEKTPVRYRGEVYHADYNGRYYLLRPILAGDCIPFYRKGRGVYGLETNRKV